MPGRLHGKAVLVVGAGASAPGWGIGRAITALFVREGARVLATDIDAAALEETRRLVEAEGGQVETATADATDGDGMERVVQDAVRRFGRLDLVQHNVGGGAPGGVADTTEQTWRRLLDLNLTSAFLTAKAALPALAGGGAITFVASVAGQRPLTGSSPAYQAAKAGLLQFARVVALEQAGRGVRANCILPGYVDTPEIRRRIAARFGDGRVEEIMGLRAATVPSGRVATVWDIAQAAVFLGSDDARHVSGTELVVDGTQVLQSVPPYLPPG